MSSPKNCGSPLSELIAQLVMMFRDGVSEVRLQLSEAEASNQEEFLIVAGLVSNQLGYRVDAQFDPLLFVLHFVREGGVQ